MVVCFNQPVGMFTRARELNTMEFITFPYCISRRICFGLCFLSYDTSYYKIRIQPNDGKVCRSKRLQSNP